MKNIEDLLANNREWSNRIREEDAEFFARLAANQTPEYLWIGCSDSRVPPTNLVGLRPGELFVHRNVANVVVHTDLNCLSVLQFAIDVLKVKHVIVCGHYGCGGVNAALHNLKLGLIDNWLRHVQDVNEKHQALISKIKFADGQLDRLCELNVIEQVVNVCRTTIVQHAWERGQSFAVHGWVYSIHDGLLSDLKMQISSQDELPKAYQRAISSLA
jgi:carbonic anhydrase